MASLITHPVTGIPKEARYLSFQVRSETGTVKFKVLLKFKEQRSTIYYYYYFNLEQTAQPRVFAWIDLDLAQFSRPNSGGEDLKAEDGSLQLSITHVGFYVQGKQVIVIDNVEFHIKEPKRP